MIKLSGINVFFFITSWSVMKHLSTRKKTVTHLFVCLFSINEVLSGQLVISQKVLMKWNAKKLVTVISSYRSFHFSWTTAATKFDIRIWGSTCCCIVMTIQVLFEAVHNSVVIIACGLREFSLQHICLMVFQFSKCTNQWSTCKSGECS